MQFELAESTALGFVGVEMKSACHAEMEEDGQAGVKFHPDVFTLAAEAKDLSVFEGKVDFSRACPVEDNGVPGRVHGGNALARQILLGRSSRGLDFGQFRHLWAPVRS